MTYEQSVRYLLSLGRELASPQQARATKFDLENIRVLCAHLGDPQRAFRSVHVAGTNGKGSTSAMLASILEAAGLRTGLYTSPHLMRINERIRIGGAEISDDDFAETFTRIHAAIENLLATGQLAAHPTYFECVTAMAFVNFCPRLPSPGTWAAPDFPPRLSSPGTWAAPDIAVIEVGLGGRLDSTNIIVPEVAIITKIDFDHENFLGHSIEAIAGEKAGIIKPNSWIIANPGNAAAAEVIRRRATEQNARLIEIAADYHAENVTSLPPGSPCRGPGRPLHDGFCRFTALTPGAPIEVELSLPGRYQMQNALSAIAAARLLAERGFPIGDAAIARGLASVHWPGRIERVCERPAVYLDGTHNPAGARELAAFWQEQFAGRLIHLIYGAMRDKAVDEVAGLLFPLAASVIVTQSPQPRSISAEVLASITRHLAPGLQAISDPGAALESALAQAGPEDIVFATGSLYLVGDLARYWQTRTDPARPIASPDAAPSAAKSA
jgi:dihydrofolate synthase / folylpolyglutamate synthase